MLVPANLFLLWLRQGVRACLLMSIVVEAETREPGTEILLILKNGCYSDQQLAPSIRLDEVAARTGGQGLFYDVWRLITTYEKNFGPRRALPNASSGRDPIQRPKTYIQ